MILPNPKTITSTDGVTVVPSRLRLNIPEKLFPKKALKLIKLFLPQCSYILSEDADISVTPDNSLSEEEYILDIKGGHAEIRCSTYNGMRYAFAAYSKLVSVKDAKICVPDVYAKDKPSCRHRGVMLDLARGIKDFEHLKEDIVFTSKMCFNVIHLHLFDGNGMCVYLDSLPENACIRGSYTKAQMKELVSLCDVLGLEIIPEFDMPAHSSNLLKAFPDFACVTDNPDEDGIWAICPGEESVFDMYERVIAELLELFPGEYFHMGGDELNFPNHSYARCNWDRCKKCKALRERENLDGRDDEYFYFVNRIYKIISKYGRKLIFWSDRIDCAKPAPVPSDVLLHFWRTSEEGHGAAGAGSFNAQLAYGYEAINSYYPRTYVDIENYMTSENLSKWHWFTDPPIEDKYADSIIGSEMCVWEYGNIGSYGFYDRTLAPCMVLFADKLWNGYELIYTDEYKKALTKAVLGAETPDGFEMFDRFFGDVIPPRTEEYAYYEKLSASEKEYEDAINILENLYKSGLNGRKALAYCDALKCVYGKIKV